MSLLSPAGGIAIRRVCLFVDWFVPSIVGVFVSVFVCSRVR